MNLHRHRRALASLFLGAWLLAMFVGMANACLPGPAAAAEPRAGMGMCTAHDDGDGPAPGCLEFCYDDAPLLGKLQLVQDQPAGAPQFVASLGVLPPPASAPAVIAEHVAHPPSDIPLLLRTLRFAL